MLDVLLVLISQAVVLVCHGCLVVCRCLQLTSCDRSVQSALAMITPAECGRLLRSPSSSSGLMAWLWTAASISQVSQQCLTMRMGAAFVMYVPVVMLPAPALLYEITNMVCLCARSVLQPYHSWGLLIYLPKVEMPVTEPQAVLTSDLHYDKGVSQKIVTFLYPQESPTPHTAICYSDNMLY